MDEKLMRGVQMTNSLLALGCVLLTGCMVLIASRVLVPVEAHASAQAKRGIIATTFVNRGNVSDRLFKLAADGFVLEGVIPVDDSSGGGCMLYGHIPRGVQPDKQEGIMYFNHAESQP